MDSKSYVTADLKLFNETVAKQLKMKVDDYNDMIINSLNKYVSDNDYLYLLGDIFCESEKDKALSLLEKVNGHVILISQIDIPADSKIKRWKVDGYIIAKINEEPSTILITNSYDRVKEVHKSSFYIAAPRSVLNQIELYKDKVLNITFSDWNYKPIELENELGQIIDDYELFNSMNENVETIL